MSAVVPVHSHDTAVPRGIETIAREATAEKLDSDTSFQAFDRSVSATLSHDTAGLSPAALAKAFFDYWLQLALSPANSSIWRSER
jgi:hypothetical protein